MEDSQIAELSKNLRQLNELLEKILHAQFGIQDATWIGAMSDIERGFSKAVNFIANVKGKEMPIVLSKEEIDKVLGD